MQLATELDRRRDKERIRQTKIFQRTAIYDNNRYMLKPSNTNSKLSKRLTIMRTSPEENRANNLLKTVGGEVNMSQALFSKMRSKVVNVDYQPMFIQGVKPLTREAATLSLIKDNRFVLFGGFVYDRKEIAYEFDVYLDLAYSLDQKQSVDKHTISRKLPTSRLSFCWVYRKLCGDIWGANTISKTRV